MPELSPWSSPNIDQTMSLLSQIFLNEEMEAIKSKVPVKFTKDEALMHKILIIRAAG